MVKEFRGKREVFQKESGRKDTCLHLLCVGDAYNEASSSFMFTFPLFILLSMVYGSFVDFYPFTVIFIFP